MTSAIEVRGLTKSYGGRAVLKGLSLEIKRGEVFALLGVNGAGKTTALECIEGLRNMRPAPSLYEAARGCSCSPPPCPHI